MTRNKSRRSIVLFAYGKLYFHFVKVILPNGQLYSPFGRVAAKIDMSESLLREKSKEFAKSIVVAMREIRENQREIVLSNQLLRSGTSIGANVHEAQYAQGSADFISKFEIALKECFESEYWLELLYETGYLRETQFKKLRAECGVIRRMLIATCKTVKSNKNE